MSKKIIAAILILSALACKERTTGTTSGSDSTAGPSAIASEAVAERDLSINKDNAYNDIFLDSTDVENFIAQQKPGDTHWLLPSAVFYNAPEF